MPCTTILAGIKATNDGSTMIARTEDGGFDIKNFIVVNPKDQKEKYKSAISHLEIELPGKPFGYTCTPNVDRKEGIWAAQGINTENVAMSATETTTSNPRVLAADPLVAYKPAKGNQKAVPGGIGEEDMVVIVLPYIRSAREGVKRLGELLEQYGTYENNGIAFNDAKEAWWFETIGGHHWMARRVPDDQVVIAPNWFSLDRFDFDDAFGKQKDNMCSADMKEFIEKNHLALDQGRDFNPRRAFGSHSDNDHIYNTPRAWMMGRCLCPTTYKWDGPNAEFTPESDNIPWCFVPEHKLTIEDVRYILSTHYQGTPYDPYSNTAEKKGMYRCIGMPRTGTMSICQIRPYMPKALQGVQWVSFGCTTFGAQLPVYTSITKAPRYLSKVTTDFSSENFYWASRLIAVLADANFSDNIQPVNRYQSKVANKASRMLYEYDAKMQESGKYDLMEEANEKMTAMLQEETTKCINDLLLADSKCMHNLFNRKDN